MARDPRAFWSEYNGRKQAATVGMAEWTEYFKGLFLAGEGRGVPDPELCDRLFREGAAGQAAFVAGQGLGETITEGEVRRAMRLLRRGKAAGVEGLPPEFVKEAWVEGGGGDRQGMCWCSRWCTCLIGSFRKGTLRGGGLGPSAPYLRKQGQLRWTSIGVLWWDQCWRSSTPWCFSAGWMNGQSDMGYVQKPSSALDVAGGRMMGHLSSTM